MAILDDIPTDPSNLQQALQGPEAVQWKAALDSEYNSLIQNQTWQLVDRPPNRSVVSCKWLFRRKYNSDGTIARHKSPIGCSWLYPT